MCTWGLLGLLAVLSLWCAHGFWGVHTVAELKAVYGRRLLPGLGGAALCCMWPVLRAKGRHVGVGGGLGMVCVLAAVGARLDERLLELALHSDVHVQRWLAERIALVWPLRGMLNLGVAVGGVAVCWHWRPRGWGLWAVLGVVVCVLFAGVQGNRAWNRIRDPAAVAALSKVPLPSWTTACTPRGIALQDLSQGGLLAAEPSARLGAMGRGEASGIVVVRAGVASLPPSLRWTGWCVVELNRAREGDSVVFGGTQQLWKQDPEGVVSLGNVNQATAALGGQHAPVWLVPGVDWRVSDVLALCAATACGLHPGATTSALVQSHR